jgi:beta-glucosidase
LGVVCLLAGCGEEGTAPGGEAEIVFGPVGPLGADAGRDGFRFGVATAAAQIEDQNPGNDWYHWTLPTDQGGKGVGEFVGDAVGGYTRAKDDVALLKEMNLDAYRFSIDWARIEPQRGQIDQAALDHYGALLDELVAQGIRPMVTIHHFSNPLWADNFLMGACPEGGPTDEHLCGWDDPVGGPLLVEELREHARLLARTFGDRVDEWCTINEPVNYLLASYGVATFPPGKADLFQFDAKFIPVVRNFIDAHAEMYRAIKEEDTTDADGDGLAAEVGLSLSVIEFEPARQNQPSQDPADLAAVERVTYVYHYLFPKALTEGGFDADLDGVLEEPHPEWAGTLDWLGAQHYFRAGVSDGTLLPRINAAVCFGGFDFGSCLPVEDETKWVPDMGYEYREEGLYEILADLGSRWPELPLVVTESGIATRNGTRRAEQTIRTLEQIERARAEGHDVRGYYHWSLMDNFEWAEGYEPKFGLYSVDLDTFARTPTEGATVYGEIAKARRLTADQRATFGGTGPMTPEPE